MCIRDSYGPDNLTYDRFLKGYRPTEAFKPVFTQGVADEYLQMMHAREDLACSFESLTVRELNTEVLLPPARDLRPAVLRPVLQACREGKRVEIEYASLANPEPEFRVIQPHTVVHTGYRWHVRAWCEKNGDFRDFVLSRISDRPELVLPGDRGAEDDEAWRTRVVVRLGPDPRLSPPQQALIERDYGMKRRGMEHGELRLETRGALVGYLLQQLRVDTPADHRSPEAQQVVLLNHDEVQQWAVMPG